MAITQSLSELTDSIELMGVNGARISETIFIPLQAAHQTESFSEDFLEGLTESEIIKLNAQWSGFSEIYNFSEDVNPREFAKEFAIDLCLHCPFPYLVKVETTQSIHSIDSIDSVDADTGTISGACFSWGSYTTEWRFAGDISHAVDQAIEIGKTNLLQHAKKISDETGNAITG